MASSRSSGVEVTVQRLSVQLRTIKQVHKRFGERLAAWWAEQGPEQRSNILLEWCPYMPLARDKPYLFVEGEGKVDVHGAALIMPECNQAELSQGNRLIVLLREVAEVPDEDEPGGHPGYDAFTELCMRNLPAAYELIGRIKSELPRETRAKGIVCMMPGERFGNTMIVQKMVPSVRDMLDKGAFITAPHYEALLLRLHSLLGSLAMCLDHYRVEILGKSGYSAVGPQMGCAHCGAVEPQACSSSSSSSGKLLACAACGLVFYCSKACQKADWKAHKPHCNPTRSGASASRDGAAAAAGSGGGGEGNGSGTAAGGSSAAAGNSR